MTLEQAVVAALTEAPRTIQELRFHTIDPVPSRRDIEEAVEALRLQGVAIVGGADGLHLTADPDELAEYVTARRRRALAIFRGSRALRATVRALREPQELTLW